MLCVPSRTRNSNRRWCCGWQWRSQPPWPQSSRLGCPGWSALRCRRPGLEWVTSFFPILALSLLMFFSSFTLPKGRVRISTASNKADRIFQVRTCFGFHPTHSARVLWFYQNSLLLALHPFFVLQILLLEHVLMFTVLYCAMETEVLIYPFLVMCHLYI